jgi:hypothetical protein
VTQAAARGQHRALLRVGDQHSWSIVHAVRRRGSQAGRSSVALLRAWGDSLARPAKQTEEWRLYEALVRSANFSGANRTSIASRLRRS